MYLHYLWRPVFLFTLLYENKRFKLSAAMQQCSSVVQEHRTDNQNIMKLQLFNNSKIVRNFGVHVRPFPGGYDIVQPVGHTWAIACHVLGSGGGADF